MRYNKKKMMLVVIVLLAIGFAAVSTTLILNGNVLLGINMDDFDVYFSKAVLDGEDVSGTVISTDGKTITYETNKLTLKGDESVLEYVVTNNSSQYDAIVDINCELEENSYVTVENTLANQVVSAKTEEEGTLTATLAKTAVDEKNLKVTCEIVASAGERDSVADFSEEETYNIYGKLLDENGNVLSNALIAVYDGPIYTTTDETGYFYIEGLEKGSHTIYVLDNTSVEEVKELDENEIATIAKASTGFTTSSLNIVFENGYEMTDEVIGATEKVTITYDANGGNMGNNVTEVSKGNYLGDLPELTRDGYEFLGWYTEADGGTKIESTTIVTEGQKLYAQWQGKDYVLTYDTNGGTVSPASKIITCGDKVGDLPTPTRTGYTFAGWYTEKSGGTQYTSESIVTFTNDFTLYAQWTANIYYVSYNGNGNTGGSVGMSLHTYDEAQNLLENSFQKKYTITYNANGGTVSTTSAIAPYTFSGWATSSTGNVAYTNGQSVINLTSTNESHVNLYAKWSGGTLSSLPTPTRTGYVFNGWYTAASGGTKVTTSTVFTQNTTIYAQWTLKIYSVGEVLTMGTESFNVISDNGSTITMLAQNNLGINYRQTSAENIVTFSDIDGWKYTSGPNDINIQLYNGNAKTYVNEYVSYLINETGDTTITGNLITLSELKELGCTINSNYSYTNGITCLNSSNVSWLKTGYAWWTRSAVTNVDTNVYFVSSSGNIGYDRVMLYSHSIRPVITVTR